MNASRTERSLGKIDYPRPKFNTKEARLDRQGRREELNSGPRRRLDTRFFLEDFYLTNRNV